jgi:hypothetical protein
MPDNDGTIAMLSDISTLNASKVGQTSSVGAAILPAGATADRPGTPVVGYIRYNNTLGSYEGYGTAGWAPIGGGGVNWQIKTANYTAASGDRIVANTSGGAFTVTLPASPTAGNYVEFADGGGAFGTNNLTISRNGSTIMGLSEDMTLSTNNISVGLAYNGTTWRIY